MRIAVRQHDNVTGRQAHIRLAFEADPTGAIEDQVVGNHVLGARKHGANYRLAAGRFGDPRLARLPSVEEIAAEVRSRPIGAVLADICRDLGIMPSHPLWRELGLTVILYGGNLVAFFKDIIRRTLPLPGIDPPGTSPPLLAPVGTGPP